MEPSPSPDRATEVFRYQFEADDYATLTPVDPSNRERLPVMAGGPISEHWAPPRMRWDPHDLPKPDICRTRSSLVIGPDALAVLAELIEGRGELLAVDVEEEDGWHLFHLTRVSDALDEDKSEIDWFVLEESNWKKILGIDRHVFHPDRIAEETIFMIQPNFHARYATDRFTRPFEEGGLKGLRFDLVWSADPEIFQAREAKRVAEFEALKRESSGERFYTHIVPTDEEVGPPDEVIAHRIIPALEADNKDLELAQAKAHRLGIGPDDAENGVWLPRARSVTAYTNSYLRELRQRLWPAEDRDQGVRVLREIAAELERGEFPHKG